MGKTKTRSTTILAVKRNGQVAMAGDGQCTMGETVCKGNSRKVRKIYDGKILTGFAGSVADAFTLLDRFETKVKEYNGDLGMLNHDLAESGGVKVKLTETKTRDGKNNITEVEVV